jgi:hypothetical protein
MSPEFTAMAEEQYMIFLFALALVIFLLAVISVAVWRK